MSWSDQLKSIETKLSRASGVISKLRHYVDYNCLRSFYFAKVYSYLQYAVLAWGGSNQTKLNKINIIHNNILRLMTLRNTPNNFRLSNNTLYKSLNLLKISDIYKFELAKIMHRDNNNSLPTFLQDIFVSIDTMHRYTTLFRRNRQYRRSLMSTCSYRNWISSAGVLLRKSVNPDLKNLNYKQFCTTFRSGLINDY